MEICLGDMCNGANYMADLLPDSRHVVKRIHLICLHFLPPICFLKEIQTCVMQMHKLSQK